MDKLETFGAAVDAVGTSAQPVLDLWGSLCANHPNDMPALLPEDVRTIATALRDSQAEMLREMMKPSDDLTLAVLAASRGKVAMTLHDLFVLRVRAFASEHGIDLGRGKARDDDTR